jgi:hypothetical protein
VLGSYIGYRTARAGIDADAQNAADIALAAETPPPTQESPK